MSNDILNYVPSGFITDANDTRWIEQKNVLLQIEEYWNKYDVLVVDSPVGVGKSLVGQTIAKWREAKKESTATIVHRVTLQDQYRKSFPYLDLLKGKGRYDCYDSDDSCEEHYDLFESYCPGCPYAAAKEACMTSLNACFNFQSYLLHKAYKQNLIIDEGHNVIHIMGDFFSLILWKHIHDYPENIETHGEVAIWLEAQVKDILAELQFLRDQFYLAKKGFKGHSVPQKYQKMARKIKELSRRVKRYQQVLSGLQRAPTNFFIEHSEEEYRGETMRCLKIRPTTLRDLPEVLWPPQHTQKIVLMSGTIAERDIREFGLHGRKVKFLDTGNPIPADNRRIVVRNKYNMSYRFQDKNIKGWIGEIKAILEENPDTKGMIHVTYALADKMKKHFKGDSRMMWHTKEDKERVLEEFHEETEPKVMVACGMSEGVDLAGQEFGFQIIGKVQWPSKKDKMIAMFYNKDIERIIWDTVRTIRQQTGRICRGVEDKGVTYIIDGAFGNIKKKRYGLFQQSRKFWPMDIIEAMRWE